jgi:hypothetical protein
VEKKTGGKWEWREGLLRICKFAFHSHIPSGLATTIISSLQGQKLPKNCTATASNHQQPSHASCKSNWARKSNFGLAGPPPPLACSNKIAWGPPAGREPLGGGGGGGPLPRAPESPPPPLNQYNDGWLVGWLSSSSSSLFIHACLNWVQPKSRRQNILQRVDEESGTLNLCLVDFGFWNVDILL